MFDFPNDYTKINGKSFSWHTDDSGVLQRVYDKEEILKDGKVVHIKMKGNKINFEEYIIVKVGPEQIRFKEHVYIKNRKKIQIPISSIGYSHKPELINYEIHLEGLCLSNDKEKLIRSMAKVAEQQAQSVSKIIAKQVEDLKIAYKRHVEDKTKLKSELTEGQLYELTTTETT